MIGAMTTTANLAVEVDPGQVGFDAHRLASIDALLDRYVADGKLPG